MNELPHDVRASLIEHGIPEDSVHRFGPLGLGELIPKLGIRFLELSAEKTVATMPVSGNTQPAGLLHGGASAAFLETLGSFASNMAVDEKTMAVGTELNITHLRSAVSGLVTGTCTAVKLGRTQLVHHIDITDEKGKLISSGRMTNMVVPNIVHSAQKG